MGQALKLFEESLKQDPSSPSTRQNLGIALFGLKKYDEAEVQFRSLQGLPGSHRAVADLFLGIIAEHHSNCREAIPLLEAWGDLLRQYPEALLSYSECEYSMGDSIKVVTTLKRFEQLANVTPAEYRQAADLDARLGLSEQAEESQSRAQSIEKQTVAGALRQSALLEKANHLRQAEELLKREADSYPTFDLLMALARIAKEGGLRGGHAFAKAGVAN